MNWLTLCRKNLTRRPVRSALTVVAVATAVGSTVMLLGLADGFERSFRAVYDQAGIDVVVLRAGSQERLNSALPESLGQRIAQIDGVAEVAASIMDMVSFDEAGLRAVPLRGTAFDAFPVVALKLVDGRLPATDERGVALLGKNVAAALQKNVGQTIRLYDVEDFVVAGIFDAENLFDDGSLIIAPADAQRLMERPGQVTGFALKLARSDDPALTDRVVRAIESLPAGSSTSGLTALPVRDHVQSLMQLRLMRGAAWLISAIALGMGAIGIVNTMTISVYERTKEIGVLRAIGWPARRIVGLIVGEAAALNLLGAAAGVLGAIPLMYALSRAPAVGGLVEGRISWHVALVGFALAPAVGMAAAIYPAYRGACIVPSEALRHE